MSEKELINRIKIIFYQSPNKSYNYKQLSKKLGLNTKEKTLYVEKLLVSLKKENILTEKYRGNYTLNPLFMEKQKKLSSTVTGTVDMKQTGKAYVITEAYFEDIKIASNNTYKALHGDTVRVRLFPKRKNSKLEGEIIEILNRQKTKFVGTVEISKNFAFFIPDNKTTPIDFFIPYDSLNGAKHGQKVLAELTDWPEHAKNPFGKIVRVLGNPGEHEVEINSILSEYDLDSTFDPLIISESEKISLVIDPRELQKRRDFRNILTFTIDPADAKDFDDALSYEKLSSTIYRIGVHIADVSHYVPLNSLIDIEAYKRATSVYLVDRVIPMLPERLSNNVCSLLPNVDKLTFSVVFDLTLDAKINNVWFGKTVINSNRRFTYEEVQSILEQNQGDFIQPLKEVNELAKKLRLKRMKNGSIDFNKKEVYFKLDSKGIPIDVIIKENKDAHKLIEEFMLLANRLVAEHIGKLKTSAVTKPFVYRVHDIPNPEKLNVLADFAAKLGYKMKIDTRKNISNSFNKLLSDCSGKGEQNLIETLAIRSMSNALYSTNNIGHYGLAFDHYTHFTSPIRRYPDLIVHRLLLNYLNGHIPQYDIDLSEICKHSSDMEKKAQLAERDSIKLKQTEYLSSKIGCVYSGLISGISKWGIFVELTDNKCEGMIRLRDMHDDYYFLDEENFQVIGHNTNRILKLGDQLNVRVKHANLIRKEIDFDLVLP